MSAIEVTVKHGRSLEEARAQLARAVDEVQQRFALMVRQVERTPDRDRVKITGTGFVVELWVDASDVHVTGELPLLGPLLGQPVAMGIKQIVQQTFKRLPP
jgi:hypothetical protein